MNLHRKHLPCGNEIKLVFKWSPVPFSTAGTSAYMCAARLLVNFHAVIMQSLLFFSFLKMSPCF